MAWPSRTIESWAEFAEIAESHMLGVPPMVGYVGRGQAASEWELMPSLNRLLPNPASAQLARILEDFVFTQFSESAALYLQPNLMPKDHMDRSAWWPIMQHYGAPTRILDWTRNIYVAAYFAVNKRPDKDGTVWMFHGKTLVDGMKQLFDDYTVHKYPPNEYLGTDASQDLVAAHNRFSDERMVTQQALFTVSRNVLTSHETAREGALARVGRANNQNYLLKIVIPKNLKIQFMLHLRRMNVTSFTLFPGLDGLGSSVTDLTMLMVNHHLTEESLTNLSILEDLNIEGTLDDESQ